MPYIGKMEAGMGLDMDTCKITKTWQACVYWRRDPCYKPGPDELATTVGVIYQGDARAKARLQAKLDDYVHRYATFYEIRGYRCEVKRREKRERKAAKLKAERDARIKVQGAAPELLAALKAKLAGAVNADELVKQALAKAEG